MRLLELERTALLKALHGLDGKAYLYGSRVDPSRKGGDIDVLVFSRPRDPYRVAQDIMVPINPEEPNGYNHNYLSLISGSEVGSTVLRALGDTGCRLWILMP